MRVILNILKIVFNSIVLYIKNSSLLNKIKKYLNFPNHFKSSQQNVINQNQDPQFDHNKT